MIPRHAGILGAGVGGLATALLLARDGHRVTLLERDSFPVGEPGDAAGWARDGIPHFLLPHAFIPRGRKELREHLGDVHAALLRAGARDVDLRARLPGRPEPEDAQLQYVAVRRPLIEWALRRAVGAEPRITVHAGATAVGLRTNGGRVTGIEVRGGSLDADLVVDAMGRRSQAGAWLGRPPRQERSDCGVIYYSRYYRVRAGRELPDGPWLFTPRGDLGYMGFGTFPGDNRTFAALLAVPTGVPELKAFRDERAFEAAVARIPLLRLWADPALVEPITPVLPMGGLQNSLIDAEADPVPGLVRVGDALGHTDPLLAHGMAFALAHAVGVARALREHPDPVDAGAAFARAAMPELRERFALATALDAQRLRFWAAGGAGPVSREPDYELFSLVAGAAVALVDADVFRVYLRRYGLLESTSVLDRDLDLQRRIESRFRELQAVPRPAGPSREEMLELVATAVA